MLHVSCVQAEIFLPFFFLCFCKVKKRMEPIVLEKFSSYVQQMHKDRDFGFETEYAVSVTEILCLSMYILLLMCCVHFRPSVISRCSPVMLLKPQQIILRTDTSILILVSQMPYSCLCFVHVLLLLYGLTNQAG